jgi:hypothetical protein
MKKLKELERVLESNLNIQKERVDSFIIKLDRNPHYQLSWSEEFFGDVSKLKLYQTVLNNVKRGASFEGTIAYLENELMDRAKRPSRSTSTVTNLLAQADLVSVADLLETIKNIDRFVAD